MSQGLYTIHPLPEGGMGMCLGICSNPMYEHYAIGHSVQGVPCPFPGCSFSVRGLGITIHVDLSAIPEHMSGRITFPIGLIPTNQQPLGWYYVVPIG